MGLSAVCGTCGAEIEPTPPGGSGSVVLQGLSIEAEPPGVMLQIDFEHVPPPECEACRQKDSDRRWEARGPFSGDAEADPTLADGFTGPDRGDGSRLLTEKGAALLNRLFANGQLVLNDDDA